MKTIINSKILPLGNLNLDLANSTFQESLFKLANNQDFLATINSVFGENHDASQRENLRQKWSQGINAGLPKIEICSSANINEAKGAFSQTNNTIYLSLEYLQANANNISAIAAVLLEEIGHFIDTKINTIDTPGDEGAIFSALVRGEHLNEEKLQALKTEDDTATITLDGQVIQIEQSTADIREVLKQAINWTLDQVESVLLNIQDAELPLIGDKLQELASETQTKINEFRNGLDQILDQLEDQGAEEVRDFIFEQLGTEGLGLLQDLDGDGDLDINDVRVTLDPDNCNFQFNLGNPTPLEILRFDLTSDFGLPNLGLTINQGQAQVNLGYEVKLNFGVDRVNNSSSFYFNTSNEDEVKLRLSVSLPDLEARGELGFLQLDIEDNGTSFFQEITFDLQEDDDLLRLGETPIIDTKLDGVVDVNLNLETSFNGSEKLPSLLANFVLQWDFEEAQLAPKTPLASLGDVPYIAFKDVQVDLGSFFTDFADPILKNVQEITKPIEPIAKFLSRPIEASDSLIGEFILADLMGIDTSFIRNILDFVNLVNSVPEDSNLNIHLGSFSLGGKDPRSNLFQLNLVSPKIFDPAPSLDDQLEGTSEQAFFNLSNSFSISDGNLAFPILQNPATAFDLFLGKNVDLFTYELPSLNINRSFSLPFLIVSSGPVFAEAGISGGFFADTHVVFGYDTFGLNQFRETDDVEDIFHGFYLEDNGDRPLVGIGLFLEAYARGGIGFPAKAVGVYAELAGGINGNIGLGLDDPNNDGKVRIDELLDTFVSSPLNLFDLQGSVGFHLDTRIGYSLAGRDYVIFDKRILEEELLDFTQEFRNENQKDNQAPFLATNLGFTDFSNDGILRLNIGSNAQFRSDGRGDISERYIIKHQGFTETNETVNISSFGVVQDYKSINKIIGDAGQGDDVIILVDRDVLVAAELSGGEGNDRLVGGNNNDTLNGNTGNDCLMGSAGADLLHGGEGNDTASYETSPAGVNVTLATQAGMHGDAEGDVLSLIENLIGSSLADSLFGNASDNILLGRGDDDYLEGNEGNDLLEGENGSDTLRGEDGNDTLIGDAINTNLCVGDEEDSLSGWSGGDNSLLPGNDLLSGGLGDDSLTGNEGNDTLSGDDGNDTLIGNEGDDLLFGNIGDDSLSGNEGNDTLSGQEGNDTLIGHEGNDLLSGQQGDDSLSGNEGNDTLSGQEGNDTLIGHEGNDLLSGQQGNDSLSGNEGNDTLSGQEGLDTLVGHTGNDSLSGNTENDLLYGNEGNDTLNGNEGVDTLYGGFDNDLLSGGTGNDFLSGDELNDTLFGNEGFDSLEGGLGDDRLDGGEQNDTLMGGYGRDTLIGGSGNDTLMGFDARDSLLGGTGNDFLSGEDGNDILNGEQGNDTLIGGTENDSLVGGLGEDSLNAGENNDIARGSEGNDTLLGGSGHDTLYGGTNQDLILGETGNDHLLGEQGNDTLNGNEGHDTLTGNDGNDNLTGNEGSDILTGGTGSDRFIYTQIQDASDRITDFRVGQDQIVLTQLFASLQLNIPDYATAISQGYLGIGLRNNQTVLLVDRDGTSLQSSQVLIAFDALTSAQLDNPNNFVI